MAPVWRVAAALICHWIWLCASASAQDAPGVDIAEQREALRRQYQQQLKDLGGWCEQQRLSDEARETRGWALPQHPLMLVAPFVPPGDPPSADETGGKPAKADQALSQWRERFGKLRGAQAEALFELSEAAVEQRQFAAAFGLLHEVLREDPRHEPARRLLGYRPRDGHWLTPYEIGKAQAKQVWHAQFGWLPKDHVLRYEGGERFYKGRWIPSAEENRLRSDIDRGWDVMTENYLVHTNHSLEEGVRLATRLERLYRVWRQIFVRYYATDEQLARQFRDGAPPARASRRHQVMYYRDREQYVAALVAGEPQIGITTGYYSGSARKAYFFAGPGQDDSTLYHEATHQLFNESRNVIRDVGEEANFWVVEGIACYFESLIEHETYGTLGGPQSIRLADARFRLLEDDFYVPLTEFCGLGREALKRDARIAKLYSQASGLTHFLVHGQEGRYREALVDYLLAIYAGRDRPSTLAELSGKTAEELDGEYREFIDGLKSTP